jgi:hypothetical protein
MNARTLRVLEFGRIRGRGLGARRKAVHRCLDEAGVGTHRLGRDDEEAGGSGVTILALE